MYQMTGTKVLVTAVDSLLGRRRVASANYSETFSLCRHSQTNVANIQFSRGFCACPDRSRTAPSAALCVRDNISRPSPFSLCSPLPAAREKAKEFFYFSFFSSTSWSGNQQRHGPPMSNRSAWQMTPAVFSSFRIINGHPERERERKTTTIDDQQ